MAEYTTFRGKKCCVCLAQWIPVLEKEAVRRGILKKNVDIAQLTGNVGASAGTHSKGGAFDFWNYSAAFIKLCRQMGADATWHRRKSQGPWSPHAHGVLRGCPHNAPARYQIGAVDAGYNGLGGGGRGGRDDGPRPLSGRTWKEGITWAKTQGAPTPPATPPVITPESAEYVVTADPFLWGLAKPGSGNEKKVERPEGSHLTSKASAKFGNGVRWVQGIDGWWSSAAYLTPVSEVPETPAPDVFETRMSILNVNADYMPRYDSRVPKLAGVIQKSRASVALICESGSYENGRALNLKLGWGGKRGESYVLHGGAVPVTTAVHLDTAKRRILHEGQFETSGPVNLWATWALLEDVATKIRCLFLVTHLEYRPIGPNTIRSYDRTRESQLNAVFVEGKKIAARYDTKAIVVGGDMNGDRDDTYDGPGKAAARHGFREFDAVAVKNTNAKMSTHAKSGGLRRGGRIDRGFCTGPVEVLELNIFDAYPHTDHNLVASLLRVHR